MAYARIIVLLGVAGSGKTTIGIALAKRLDIKFEDGDSLHPQVNVAKMARGEPLSDADRGPWLRAIELWMDRMISAGDSGILACSGLRRAYRTRMRGDRPVKMVFLRISRDVAEDRISKRAGHFFRAALLDSQFATLEEPTPDEDVEVVDATLPIEELVEQLSDL